MRASSQVRLGLLLFGLSFGLTASAQTWDINNPALSENRSAMRFDPIYLETIKACTNNPDLVDETVADTNIFKSVFASSSGQALNLLELDPFAILSLYHDRGLSPVTANLFRYQPFLLAVNECFPWDIKRQNLFLSRFILTDILGKAAVAASGFAASYAIWKTGRLLIKKIPTLKKYVKGAGILTAVMIFFDMSRKQRWSPTPDEKKQMMDYMAAKADGTRQTLIESNRLLESDIDELQSKFATLNPDQKLRLENLIRIHQRNLNTLNSSLN